VKTNKGTLLAFAEARRKGCGDTGDIDLVCKRSEDGGKSWSAMSVIWNDGENTCGNPAPVVEQSTGSIILLSTWNLGSDKEPQIIDRTSTDSRRVFVLSSTDDGNNWTLPREITSEVKQPNWTWYATGPVNGIQLRHSSFKGRLLIPCDHIEAETKKYFSHIIYSDDGGLRWYLGGSTPSDGVNESSVAELPNGELLLNMRNYTGSRIRQIARSKDGGMHWSKPEGDPSLPEPVCQASLLSVDGPLDEQWLAFSNPADGGLRVCMTVRISKDGGHTWPLRSLLHAGPSAYSNLVMLTNGNLACLFESGEQSAYENIVFREIFWDEFKGE
jgi:sialidase-1